ncbi:MAG TPA: iron-sulfur cluster assembly scaffold protein [Candidatus Saccharimonadales bacterium]|nr:iron-sulfur cluster assembly scaffold protein [Candidatus Saccharimonadales bacterium]
MVGVRTDLDMYAETLIYTYEHPQHKGTIKDAEATMHEENISCGDRLTIYIKLEGEVAKDVKFDGVGCVISMGSADILADHLKGKKISEIMKFGKDDLLKLISIDPGPVRMHCATLSLRAVRKAIFSYENRPIDASTKEL